MLGILVAVALALEPSTPADRWRLSASDEGLTAEVMTELGHGAEVSLIFYCNAHGRSSMIGRQGDFGSPEFTRYMDALMPAAADPSVETYRNGQRTARFAVTGPESQSGADQASDARLNLVREADFLVLTGGSRPVLLPTNGATTVIAQFIAACGVLRPSH